jgi:curved DNA-binding protein CbpA
MKWREIKNGYIGALEKLKSLSAHELLDVSPECTIEEVKAAYRRKIRTYHPDRMDDFMKTHGEEVSKLLNAAYQQLLEEKNDERK